MPAIDDDDRPKKKIAHEIGQDLTLLSVEELAARVQLLKDEIARLEADMAQQARQTRGRRSVLQAVTSAAGSRPWQKIPHSPQSGNVSLSFLDHYWARPSSWTLSGSCPLCLTPPCYHLEPPATAALFLSHFGSGADKAAAFAARLSLPGNYVASFAWTGRGRRAMLTHSYRAGTALG